MSEKSQGTNGRLILGTLIQAPKADLNRLMGIYRLYLKAIAEHSIPDVLRSRLEESDLVQEALLRGASQIDTFRGQTDAEFAGWLRKILENVIVDAVRHYTAQKRDCGREREPHAGSQSSDASLSEEILQREELQRVAAALLELSSEQRIAVELRSQGNSFEEIGRLTGKSPDAARMQWGRAIERLTHILEKSG